MATPLAPAHRRWRAKVFVATWLSYVGFYFCRKPLFAAKKAIQTEGGWSTETIGNVFAAFYIAYAVGQFVASRMGTRLGPRRNVLLGMAVSLAVTLAMTTSLDWRVAMALAALNGLAQATGWSGNVGAMAGWFHKHERGKVMGLWSTNFNIGSLASGWVLAAVLGTTMPAPWRSCFYTGAIVLAAIWIQFVFLQRDRPEDVGLPPIDDPATEHGDGASSGAEVRTPEPPPEGFMGLSRTAWANLMLVAGFYFFVKFIRYAIWSWAPYFIQTYYDRSAGAANLYATAFDILGLPGVFLTGWISDRYFRSSRAGISFAFMAACSGFTAALALFYGSGLAMFVPLLALVGLTCYGPDALLTGAGAIDIGGRRAATFAAAVISGFGSTGSVVQEVVIARVYDPTSGSLTVVLAMLVGSAIMATAFCAALVWRNRRGGKGI